MNSAYPSRRAERSLFKELFESPAKVHLNGGVITGGAIPNHGLPLDGTTQYATFAIGATDLTRDEINIEIVFNPDFAADDSVVHFLFDSTPGHRYLLFKEASNKLTLYLGNTNIVEVSLGTYSPYWNQGEKNRLLVSSNGVLTNVWLNGNHIVVDNPTAWTPKNPTTLYIGAGNTGTLFFSGTIHSVEFRAGLLTQLDVDAIESDSLFNYRNRANLILDMKEQTERAGTILGTTETLTDGDCEAVGVGAWTAFGGAALSKVAGSPGGSGSQVIHITGAVAGAAYQLTTSVVGKRYRVRGWARGDGTGVPGINTVGLGTIIWTGDGSGAWQYFDAVAVSDHNSGFLFRHQSGGGAGNWVEFDDVEVFETDELLNDPDMEETGVGAWSPRGGAAITKVTASPVSGLQNLRVTGGVSDAAGQTKLTIGRQYRARGWMRSDGTSVPQLVCGVPIWVGAASGAWQEFNFIFTAANATLWYWIASAGGWIEVDNISVKQVLAQTLDKSPKGHVCLLGDGFTAASIPTFENPGFDFDGTNQYMLLPQASGIFNNVGQTIACLFQPDFAADDGVFHYLLDTPVGTRYLIAKDSVNQLQVYLGNSSIIIATLAAFVDHWRVDGLNVLTVVGTSGATTLWLNGVVVGTNSGVWTPVDPAVLYLGASSGIASFYDGGMEGFMTWPFQLSPLQVRDLTISLGVNV